MLSMRSWFRSLLLVLAILGSGAVLPSGSSAQPAQAAHAAVLLVKGIINPAAASYVERAIGEAESAGARVIIIEMDTPGGLDTSMRGIIQRIIAARVPVAVYVAPQGARAGSAGVYITYAAHIAAMAPSTNIGSAHPVSIGESGEQTVSDTMNEKITNDAVAYIKGLAQSRGRNAEWAEKAVRESMNITAQQALEMKVIDLVANDLSSLLDQMSGRSVRTASGTVTLNTEGLAIRRYDMSAVESFLHVISDPTIAYILLSLGTMGLIFELSNPGAILPGVAGGIFLLFALYGLGTLPVNIAGLLLIAFAFLLFVTDIFAPTHGFLTAGGTISFLLGSMLLINTQNAPFLAISTPAIVAVTLTLTVFFFFAVAAIVRSRRRRPTTGLEGMIGQTAEARTDLDPEGMVFVDGALWKAVAESGKVGAGEVVEIVGERGLTLVVRPSPGKNG